MIDILYVKYGVAFIATLLTAGIIFSLIRKVTDFIISLILIGSASIACYGLNSGRISTWTELLTSSVLLGTIAAIVCIPLLPFSSIEADLANKGNKADRKGTLEPLTPSNEASRSES